MEDKLILEVKDLSVFYPEETANLFGKTKKKQVCKNITFSLQEGEILGVLGESGCGKSTLAKTILGMTDDYKGEVIHYSAMPQMVFQDPYSSLNPAKTVGFLLEEPLRIQRIATKEERKKRVLEMLEKVGLPERYVNHYPSQLSGGQRQRVCIAAALMLTPKLLIADEPVSALDVTIQAQIMELFLKLHEEMKLSILFISHDLRVVYQMSDRVMVMRNGEIVETGSTTQIYQAPKTEYMHNLLVAADIRKS